jgi:hypothetical protein
VSLLSELDAFFTDHHQCGDLDAGVEGPVVWIACECDTGIDRPVETASIVNARAMQGRTTRCHTMS